MSKQLKILLTVASLFLVGLLLYFILRKKQAQAPVINAPASTGQVSDLSNGINPDLASTSKIRSQAAGTMPMASGPAYNPGTVAVPAAAYTGSRPEIYSTPVVPQPIVYSQPVASEPVYPTGTGTGTSLDPVTQTGSR